MVLRRWFLRCLARLRFSLHYEVAIDVRSVIYLTSNASDVGRFRPFPVSCLLAMVVNGLGTGGLALRVLLAWVFCRWHLGAAAELLALIKGGPR